MHNIQIYGGRDGEGGGRKDMNCYNMCTACTHTPF